MSNSSRAEHVDASPDALAQAWRALGAQLAVIGGSGVALVSLFQDTPVRVASLRGAATWAAILAFTSVGAWLAPRTWRAPEVEADEESEDDEAAGASTG